MASSQSRPSLYPEVVSSSPSLSSPFLTSPSTSTPSIYPTLDLSDLPQTPIPTVPDPIEETLITVPGAVLHLIDPSVSHHLASGDLSVSRLRNGDHTAAVLASVGDVHWPLAKDEAVVKLDDSHYFFSFHIPDESNDPNPNPDLLNYGLTFASKGQEKVLKELDEIFGRYCSFEVKEVEVGTVGEVAKGTAPEEVKDGSEKKEVVEREAVAYWTTLAPNVEDYSNGVAKMIAAGSGQLIRGILWCGDVTVDRLKWGHDVLIKRIEPKEVPSEVSPQVVRRLKRVRTVTKMSKKVAKGVLTGVVTVTGFFTSSVVNSKAGKKFFQQLPGEVLLASLDGFGKICDAVEMAGKKILSTSSDVTTGLVSRRYGEQAGEATDHGLNAAGHAIGTAWTVFKLRKALNPKDAMKPTSVVKSAAKAAAAEVKSKKK